MSVSERWQVLKGGNETKEFCILRGKSNIGMEKSTTKSKEHPTESQNYYNFSKYAEVQNEID